MAFQAPFMTTTRGARPPPRYAAPTRPIHGAQWSPNQTHRRVGTDVSYHLSIEVPPSIIKCEGHVEKKKRQAAPPFPADIDANPPPAWPGPSLRSSAVIRREDDVEELAMKAALTTDLKERKQLLKLLDGRSWGGVRKADHLHHCGSAILSSA
mmetsp:Transcript_56032/g.133492  ORF Transcript_56032/g.133492 Transcript_56032/m.133492 type:complete len:153 (-) Transcript_56032:81-539(-)